MVQTTERTGVFKQCSLCGHRWADLADVVVDRDLKVTGYQACFVSPEMGLVLMTHCVEDCGTTLALRVKALRELYDGPQYTELRAGQESCREYCLQHNILEECDVDCELAWMRSVLQYLRRHELPPHLRRRG
ncbi:MAG: hypothetical protein ACOX9R_02370 [Armatimonadota bacterium]|jgi:hypothetical protein